LQALAENGQDIEGWPVMVTESANLSLVFAAQLRAPDLRGNRLSSLALEFRVHRTHREDWLFIFLQDALLM
jgi:hypothetical protein